MNTSLAAEFAIAEIQCAATDIFESLGGAQIEKASDKEMIVCVVCCKRIHSDEEYINHMIDEHADSGESNCSPDDPDLDTGQLSCTACARSFKSLAEFEIHKSDAHQVDTAMECPNCHYEIGEDSENNEISNCPICNYDLTSEPETFQEPLTILFENESEFKCSRCDEIYPDKILLRDHQIAAHPGQYNGYLCRHNGCNKKFFQNKDYVEHLETHRLKFCCQYCLRSFSGAAVLRIHIRSHTGEKPFRCTVCDKTFAVTDYLNKHMRVHTGEKPFICDYGCGTSFKQATGKKIHMNNSCPLRNKKRKPGKKPKKSVIKPKQSAKKPKQSAKKPKQSARKPKKNK